MIKIDVLDYKYDDFSNNQVNFFLPTVNQGWDVITQHEISITSATGTDYIYPVTGNLTEGLEYELSITVSDAPAGQTAEIGFSTNGSAGTPNDMPSTMRRSSNGTTTGSFTAAGVQGLRVFAGSGASGTLTAKCTQKGGINWDKSIAGTLEVGNSEEFPLALTFSISEARDLNARTGTFSKTFDIPASKNNNKVLKASYYQGSVIEGNTINTKKSARISVDDIYSLTGLLQVTAISQSSEPLYYSCVFYGNNIDWSQSLDDKLLMDLSVNSVEDGSGWDNLNGRTGNSGIGLQVYEPSISSSWNTDSATSVTSLTGTVSANTIPVIYPIVGYGVYNSSAGSPATIQLLKNAYDISGSGTAAKVGYTGNWNNGDSYETPVPTSDWRPAIFIYDIIKQIFSQEGYGVVSNFIETDFFKKLLMLLPNFLHNNVDERELDNSYVADWGVNNNYLGYYLFQSSANGSNCVDSGVDSWPTHVVKWDAYGNFNMTYGNAAIYDNSDGTFTIKEFGFYDISQNYLGMWISDMCSPPSTSVLNNLEYAYVKIQRKTAGQTYWKTIKTETIISTSNPIETTGCPAPPFADKSHSQTTALELDNYYLNKGDTIRWVVTMRISQWSTPPCRTMQFEIELFGGSNPTNSYASGGDNDRNGFVSIMHRGEKVEYGQTYDLKNVIDNKSTQLNFLKGIIHSFNLQLTTDTVSKTVYIEPFNDFFKSQNEAIDWTPKLDLSKLQEDKWINADMKREIIFKYKTDSEDKKVEHRGNTYWDGILDEFPYREFLSSEFEVGTTIFENPFFAGSYNSGDGMTSGTGASGVASTPFRALLWGLCNSGAMPTSGSSCRPDKGYKFTPRLLNYVKDNCNDGTWGGTYRARVQAWAFFGTSFQDPYITAGTSSLGEYSVMARACSYDNHTAYPNNQMQPLTYASKNQGAYDCSTNTQYSQYPYRGLYQNYYQNMIEMNKSNPRVKTAYFNLKLTDLVTLDLRRLVYFDGYYYRINKIIDYRPSSNETTQVELIRWDIQGLYPANAAFNH